MYDNLIIQISSKVTICLAFDYLNLETILSGFLTVWFFSGFFYYLSESSLDSTMVVGVWPTA